MQTPQILELAVLESLLQDVREAGGTITDEISLLIRSGGKARVVENSDWNIKVTYPRDLELAEMILESRGKTRLRNDLERPLGISDSMNAQLTTLSSGLRIATCEVPHAETAAIGIWAGVGGRHEPANLSGISHFIEHMLFKGTCTALRSPDHAGGGRRGRRHECLHRRRSAPATMPPLPGIFSATV